MLVDPVDRSRLYTLISSKPVAVAQAYDSGFAARMSATQG